MPKVVVVGKRTQANDSPKALSEPKYRDGFIKRVVAIIADDIRAFVFRKKVIIEKEPEGWEDYQRFCEMARGKK